MKLNMSMKVKHMQKHVAIIYAHACISGMSPMYITGINSFENITENAEVRELDFKLNKIVFNFY